MNSGKRWCVTFPQNEGWRGTLWVLAFIGIFVWVLATILRLTPDPSVECVKIPGATWSSDGGGYCMRESSKP